MTSDRWQQIEELCQAALDRPAEARAEFLSKACDGDEALLCEVESLLSHSGGADSFIEGPAVDMIARSMAKDHGNELAGKKIGHYHIRSHVGSGGMGEVYLAEDTGLERIVALKFLPETLRIDENARRRFLREARLASAIDHTNVCTIYEINEDSGMVFIAMQYIEGETLRQVMAGQSVETDKLLSIATQLAAGLAAAHEQGIVHRDLKPTNIIITGKGQVKILDFGLAKPFDQEETRTPAELTQTGALLGTPAYMSPEQVRAASLDQRSDIFSLGVILYEMATGRAAFNHSERGSVEVMHAIAHEQAEPLISINAAVPPALQTIIERAMAKSPDDRYQSAREMLTDLKHLELHFDFEGEYVASPNQTGIIGTAYTVSSTQYIASEIKQHKRGFAAGLTILVVAAIGFGYWFLAKGTSKTTPVGSIAVLPLTNLTGDPANDYLCDGMTESLITALSKVENLRVIARGSSFAIKAMQIDSAEAGKTLAVETVLSGSVQKDGDVLRVSSRLVSTAEGRVLWATEIQKPIKDIFALQAEIARSVAGRLKPQTAENPLIASRPTDNVEAYNLYMKGRYFWHLATEDSLLKSIEYFSQASVLDPNFVLAHCGLSDAYNGLGFYFRSPIEVMPQAGTYAAKALALDPNSPDAHFSAAAFKFWYERDWFGAESEVKRALELAPNHALAHNLYGDYLVAIGRKDEGLAQVMRAVELDPLAHYSNCDLAWQYYNSRQNEKAIAYARQNLEMVNYCPFDALYIGQSLGQQGKYEESVAELEKVQAISKDWSPALAEQGYAFGMSGQHSKARNILSMLTKTAGQRYVDPFSIAIVQLGLGDEEATFASLERAFQSRSPNLLFLNVDAKFDKLRDHPRFQNLVRLIGLE